MKKIIIFLIFLISLSTTTFAQTQTDYSKVKGDYKILCLGDTKEVVDKKLKYLFNKKEIFLDGINTDFFLVKKGGIADEIDTYVYLTFYKNKLNAICIGSLSYDALEIDYKIKDLILNKIKPTFVKLYGEPTKEWEYPDITKVANGERIFAVWSLEKKLIVLLINEESGGCGPFITIYDKKALDLMEQETELRTKLQEKEFENNF